MHTIKHERDNWKEKNEKKNRKKYAQIKTEYAKKYTIHAGQEKRT